MSFLYPAFLIGAVAVAIPIVLHLLQRDVAPEVPFTAVRLLRRSPVESDKRRRLRDVLLLMARVAALVLLASAFARPYIQRAAPDAVRVVAIDRSYSMSGPGTFARALEMAREAIAESGSRERVAVVAFDDHADVLAARGDAASARAALDKLEPGFGATRYRPVFERTFELAEGAGGRLVVVTDLQRAGWEGEAKAVLPPGWQLEVRDVGAATVNAAVTSLLLEPGRVRASVRNSGTSAQSGRMHLMLDGHEVTAVPYAVDAGRTTDVPIAWRTPASGALAVSIDDPGGLSADDARFAALDGLGPAKVLVVTAGGQAGLYLARALETSAGEEGAFDTKVVTGSALAAMPADRVRSHAVVALLSTRGLDRRARETLATYVLNGGGLLVAAAPDLEVSVLGTIADWRPSASIVGQVEHPLTLTATDVRHPIFRPFGALAANLGQVRFDRAWRVRPDGWHVVARFSDATPALLERRAGQGRVVLFASDLDRRWNDFPLHPSFVPFAIETVRYTSGDRRSAREYTVADAPAGVIPRPGVYQVAPNTLPVAINVDAREGTLDRMSRDDFDRMVEPSTTSALKAAGVLAQQAEAQQSYWQYGLMLMIVALVAESFIGRA
jgi:hypothetical protein